MTKRTSETNLPYLKSFNPLPEKIDIDTIDHNTLREYGLPVRPDISVDQEQYYIWRRLMLSELIQPIFIETNVRHIPRRKIAGQPANTSPIWSGYVVTNNNNSFAAFDAYISGTIFVPGPINNFGVPIPSPCACSIWIGIDGDGNGAGGDANDVLQCGIQINFDSPSNTSSVYAWVEWFPLFEQRINLPVNWGDQIWCNLLVDRGGLGYFNIFNMTNQQRVTLELSPPPGIKLIGNCAEWIVERPQINGQTSNLAPYGGAIIRTCVASLGVATNPVVYVRPSNVSNGSSSNVSMIDANQKILSSCKIIESSAYSDVLAFANT